MVKRILLISLISFILIPPLSAMAITPNDLQSLQGDSIFYWPNQQCNANSNNGSSSNNLGGPGNGAPNGAEFPNLNPLSMANAINKWIISQNPNSELKGLGSTIVADGQHSNVNPFLIVEIAKEESSLASPTDYNVIHGNNSFGRTASPGQPSFQGSKSWYYWSSVKASVDYSAPENVGKSYGGDMGSYLRAEYGSELNSNNIVAAIEAYAPPSANNTAQYIQNIQTWMTQLINYTTSSSSSSSNSGSSTSSSSSSQCSSGAISCNTNNQSSSSTTSQTGTATQNQYSMISQRVVCIAQQQLGIWQSQSGYPWKGPNTYSETGYLQYSQGRKEEWCADFVSWVFNQAGYPLAPDPNWDIPGVLGVQAIGQENGNFSFTNAKNFIPQPGDIAIHNANGEQHTNIVVGVSGQKVTMIGGDQSNGAGTGPYPGGSIVSYDISNSPYSDNITGYVIPK